MKKEQKRGRYAKAWLKCVAKLHLHQTAAIQDWNHYQLLGYVISQTNEVFLPIDDTETNDYYEYGRKRIPADHPMLEGMRSIFRQFNKSALETKKFLDYCLSKFGRKLRIKGLQYLRTQYLSEQQETQNPTVTKQRCDPLPDIILPLFRGFYNNYDMKTYGDLAMMNNIPEMKPKLIQLLATLNLSPETLQLEKVT